MTTPDAPYLVPVATLAAVLGVTRRYIQKLAQDGVLPEPVAHGRYDLEGCARAFIEHLKARAGRSGEASDYAASRALSEAARARLLTMEADEREGELVSLALVKAEVFQMARTVRDGLQATRNRLVPLLAAENDPLKVDAALRDEFGRLSDEFSSYKRLAH